MTPYFGFSYQRASAKALTSFLINEMSSRRASYAVHYAYTFHYRYIRYLFTIQNTRWDDIPHISYRFFSPGGGCLFLPQHYSVIGSVYENRTRIMRMKLSYPIPVRRTRNNWCAKADLNRRPYA